MYNTSALQSFLDGASDAYYKGKPVISDEQFDYLADLIGYSKVGHKNLTNKGIHYKRMYSLAKYYPGEGKMPLSDYTGVKVTSPKLDGAAISLLYVKGVLIQALTRGDGIEGEVITDKVLTGTIKGIPLFLVDYEDLPNKLQVTGEVVAHKDIPNSRNYVSGALGLKSVEEFKTRELTFIAYDSMPQQFLYTIAMSTLKSLGFNTVTDSDWEQFPQDGQVVRVNCIRDFEALGYTAKHPKGAYALKTRKEGKVTILREVIWQTGKSGKVTPVAIFDPVELGGAMVVRATLNNDAYIRALDLNIGDFIEIQRAGEIIPQVVRKVSQE